MDMDKRKKSVGLNFHKISDHENRKVIVRTFDMPTKTTKGPFNATILRGLPSDKEKWRYQFKLESTSDSDQSELHVKPTRVYPGRKVPGSVTGSTISSHVSALIQPNQNIASKLVPDDDVVVISPKNICTKETPLITEKITLNNLPESIVGNSIKIVNSKEVDGKKILYFKAVKSVNQTAPKLETLSVKSGSSYQLKLDELPKIISDRSKQIPSISSSVASSSGIIHVNKSQVVSPLKLSPPKKPSTICVSSGDGGSRSDIIVENIVEPEHKSLSNFSLMKDLKLPTSNRGKKPIILVNSKLMPCTDLSLINENANSSSKGQSYMNGQRIVSQHVADTLKNVRGLKESETGSLCFEVLRPRETASLSNRSILKSLDSQQCVIDAPNLKRKFVQADSTTPSVISEDSEPVYGKQAKLHGNIVKTVHVNKDSEEIPYDALTVNKNSVSFVVLQPGSDIMDTALPLSKKQSSDCKVPLVPKHNLMNAELLRKRQQIALQFQQETLKAQELPRVIRTIKQPAKTFQEADISTQTSLFSLVEPGRMVEMFVDASISGSGDTISPTSVHDLGSTSNMPELTSESASDSNSPKRRCVDLLTNSFTNGASSSSNIMCNNQSEVLEMLNDNYGLQFNNVGKAQSIDEKLNFGCKMLAKKNFNPFHPSGDPLISTPPVNSEIKKKLMKIMLKHYQECLIADEDGNLPIHNAVMDEDLNEVKKQCRVLKARKESLDVKNADDETPLKLAVEYENFEIVEELIKFGADPSIQDTNGNTVLHLVINHGDLRMFEMIMKNVEDRSSVLNQTNDEGFSPLHLCAIKNKVAEAMILVNKGANINERDRKSGRTPLFHAVEGNHHQVARKLIDFGASTTVPNFNGQIPLNASELNLAVDVMNQNDGEELHASLMEKVVETSKTANPQEHNKKSLSNKIVPSSRTSTKCVPIVEKNEEYLITIKANSDVHTRSNPKTGRESQLALHTIRRTNPVVQSNLTLNSINSCKSNLKAVETSEWKVLFPSHFDYDST